LAFYGSVRARNDPDRAERSNDPDRGWFPEANRPGTDGSISPKRPGDRHLLARRPPHEEWEKPGKSLPRPLARSSL